MSWRDVHLPITEGWDGRKERRKRKEEERESEREMGERGS